MGWIEEFDEDCRVQVMKMLRLGTGADMEDRVKDWALLVGFLKGYMEYISDMEILIKIAGKKVL